jgi:hypothetical protein
MDAIELSLGLCILGVAAVNTGVLLYAIRELNPKSSEKTDEEKEERDGLPENPPEPVSGAPKRPTTKAGILAWRQRIIEEIEKERGTKVITMIHKKELWTEPGQEPEIGIEDRRSPRKHRSILSYTRPEAMRLLHR